MVAIKREVFSPFFAKSEIFILKMCECLLIKKILKDIFELIKIKIDRNGFVPRNLGTWGENAHHYTIGS